MAQLRQSIEIPTDYSDGWREREAEALSTAQKTAQARNKGDLVGEILRWQRADGYAQYMVVSQKPLALAHLIIGDAWQVEAALIRGLRLTDVREMVRREGSLRKLFSKKSHDVGW